MFTDNQNPVNLLALDMKTGETMATMPVIDELPEDVQVSVENSAIVYDNGSGNIFIFFILFPSFPFGIKKGTLFL